MASVTISAARFSAGDLPEVCAKTGDGADMSWPMSASGPPPAWSWVLLLLGVLPFFLARRRLAPRVDGLVPLSTAATTRVVQATRLRTIGLVLAIVLLAGSVVLDSPQLFLAAVGATIMAVVATLAGAWWFVGGSWDRGGDRVVLRRVHPAFVEAVGRQ